MKRISIFFAAIILLFNMAAFAQTATPTDTPTNTPTVTPTGYQLIPGAYVWQVDFFPGIQYYVEGNYQITPLPTPTPTPAPGAPTLTPAPTNTPTPTPTCCGIASETDPLSVHVDGTIPLTGDWDAEMNISANTLFSDRDLFLNYDGPDGDAKLYFYDGGVTTGQSIMWDDSESKFALSSGVNVTGGITGTGDVTAGGNVYCEGKELYINSGNSTDSPYIYFGNSSSDTKGQIWQNNANDDFYFNYGIHSYGSLFVSQSIYADHTILGTTLDALNNMAINGDGDGSYADSDGYLYFFDDSYPLDEYLKWHDGGDEFYFSNDLRVNGGITAVSGKITSSSAQITSFTTAGFVKNDASGNLSGGNTIDESTLDHNSLAGLQGGTTDEYYHLTSDEHDAVQALDTTYLALNCSNDPLTNQLRILQSGTAKAGNTGTVLVLQNSGTSTTGVGINMISGTGGVCNIFAGDTDSTSVGKIEYSNSTNKWRFKANNTWVAYLTSGGIYSYADKGKDLGSASLSWDDVYADDFNNTCEYPVDSLDPVKAILSVRKKPVKRSDGSVVQHIDFSSIPDWVRGYEKKRDADGNWIGGYWKDGKRIETLEYIDDDGRESAIKADRLIPGAITEPGVEFVGEYTGELKQSYSVNKMQSLILLALQDALKRIEKLEAENKQLKECK